MKPIIVTVKIYTRTGDAGETGLFDGTRVSKADARVATYGDVDELNAWLGLARVDLDVGCAFGHAAGEREPAALQPLVYDREPAAGPHQQLDHRAAPVEEDEHVSAERIEPQRRAHLVSEPIE